MTSHLTLENEMYKNYILKNVYDKLWNNFCSENACKQHTELNMKLSIKTKIVFSCKTHSS